MRGRRVAVGAILFLLSITLSQLHIPCPSLASLTPFSSSDTLPDDGDVWTENNNATYPWVFHENYRMNNSISWTNEAVRGAHSINVTMNDDYNQGYFRLILDTSYNVTSYDGICFWIKTTSASNVVDLTLIVNPINTNWDSKNKYDTAYGGRADVYNNTWAKVFVPLQYFRQVGTISWSSIRQIYFKVYGRSGKKTTLLIDNLHFGKYELDKMPTPTADMMKIMPMTFYNLKRGQHFETIDGKTYTTMYDWQYLGDNSFADGGVEIEVLAHNIYALSIAYDRTGFEFYVDEAERLAQMLLAAQEKKGLGKGLFHNSYNKGWSDSMGMVYQGWAMSALAYLYKITTNSTYKTSLELQKDALVGVMWNDTYKVFNDYFKNSTQQITYANELNPMRDGANLAGISLFYEYVSQNSTVMDRIDKVERTGTNSRIWNLTKTTYADGYEDNSYFLTGIYWAYQATSNANYKHHFLQGINQILSKHIVNPNLNGSSPRDIGYSFFYSHKGDYNDGWGLHNSLPLFFFANELSPHDYYINAVERSLFMHLYGSQDDDGGFQRAASGDEATRQYFGSPAFVLLALQLYHLHKTTTSYMVTCDGRISNISLTESTMTFTVNKTGTSTTQIYVGEKGEPLSVSGALNWSYSAPSKLVSITAIDLSLVQLTFRKQGDINGDGTVNLSDLVLFSQAYASTNGSLNWNAFADLKKDLGIDIFDLNILARNYGS